MATVGRPRRSSSLLGAGGGGGRRPGRHVWSVAFGLVHDGVVDLFEVGRVDTVADAIQKALAAIDH